MFKRTAEWLATDFGATRFSCGVFRVRREGKLVLDHVVSEALDGGLTIESLWRERVSRALGTLAGDKRFHGQLAAALPGHLTLTKFIKIPRVERSKRGKVIEFEASQAMPYPLDGVVWDHLELAEDRSSVEVVVSAAKTESMLGLWAAVSASGHTMAQASPSCLALYDGFRYSYPEVRESGLVVDVGGRSTQLLLVENDRFLGRTLSFGGNVVTQAVADELGLDFSAAEALKIKSSSSGSNESGTPAELALQRGIEAFSTRLRAEIVRSIVSFRQQGSGADPTAVYITGRGARLPAVAQLLAEHFKVPVHRIEALRRVEVSPVARSAGVDLSAVPLQLVGLASRLATQRKKTLNLLPIVVKNELAFRRRQPALIAGAVLAMAALIPPLFHFHSLATAAVTTANELDDQTRPLRDIHNRNTDLQQKIDQAKAAVIAWENIEDKKNTWLRFLADLQGRLVAIEDVWLETLSVARAAPRQIGSPAQSEPREELRIVLSGRLLDQANPISKASPESYDRVKRLLASMSDSEFVAAVEQERFDNSVPGILRFDVTLVIRPQRSL